MVEKVLQINNEKTIFWTLLAILVLFAGMYIYLVKTTIDNVIARQNLEGEASTLSLSLGNQEFEYITKRNAINLELAYSMGFKDSQTKIFVSRNSTTKVAYLGN